MSKARRPKLRPLTARRIEHQGQSFVMLQDPAGVVPQPVLIPFDGYAHIVRHFDGQSTLIEIQARVLRDTGQFVAMKELEDLVRRFDEAMILEGPAFAMFHQQYRESGRRPAALAGRSYAATLRALRAQLEQFFVGQNGAGIAGRRWRRHVVGVPRHPEPAHRLPARRARSIPGRTASWWSDRTPTRS